MNDRIRAHVAQHAEADARKLVATAIEDERRRMADRRATACGGRRAEDLTHVVVIPPADCEEGGMYEDLVDEPETEEE
jgi:hypothetical protein